MSDATRRGFLALAGVGVAAGATAVALPGGAAGAEELTLPPDAEGAMVAYIHDLTKNEVALMIDGREQIVTDKQLVARLARAFAQANHA